MFNRPPRGLARPFGPPGAPRPPGQMRPGPHGHGGRPPPPWLNAGPFFGPPGADFQPRNFGPGPGGPRPMNRPIGAGRPPPPKQTPGDPNWRPPLRPDPPRQQQRRQELKPNGKSVADQQSAIEVQAAKKKGPQDLAPITASSDERTEAVDAESAEPHGTDDSATDDVVSLYGGSDFGDVDNAAAAPTSGGGAVTGNSGTNNEGDSEPTSAAAKTGQTATASAAENATRQAGVASAAPKQSGSLKTPRQAPLLSSAPVSASSAPGSGAAPDLRNQLSQGRKAVASGGGLLPRPPASTATAPGPPPRPFPHQQQPPSRPQQQQPPARPQQQQPPPRPQQQQQMPPRPQQQQQMPPRPQQQQQPPLSRPQQQQQYHSRQQQQRFSDAAPPPKRSRTLLDNGPEGPPVHPSFRGGRFQPVSGGGPIGSGRGRGRGRGIGLSSDGDSSVGSRVLLPTPTTNATGPSKSTPPVRLQPSKGADKTAGGSLLLLPTSSAPERAAPPAALLSTPDEYLTVTKSSAPLLADAPSSATTLLPTPAEPIVVTQRAPLLAAPTRSHVLPLPRQIDAASIDSSVEPSLLSSSLATGVVAAPQVLIANAPLGGGVSATAIAAYPTEPVSTFTASATTGSGATAGGAIATSSAAVLGKQTPRVPLVKTEAQMRTDLTEAFKSLQFERGYELLKEARSAYPHEFTDLVVYEVVEFCATKEAFDVCVLTARLISEPNVKLLELLADLAEKNPGQLRHMTDELWLVFNHVLTLQPDATAMMAFIRCFSSLKSWTKVWSAVDRFAPMQIIPIEGFIFCIEALVNGNAAEFINLGISLLSNMDLQNLQQVGLELIERLWLRCALDGSSDNVGRIEQIRALFNVTPAQHSNFLNRIRVKVTELVMGNEFEPLCKFFSSVTNLEVLSEFVIDALQVAEDPLAKFELLVRAISDKFRNSNPTMETFISQTAVRLLKKSVERMQWGDSLKLLRTVQGLNVSLLKAVSATQADMSEAFIANLAFQIYLRNKCYSIAASMLSSGTSPIGIALPVSGEHAATRFQLLHELCAACIAEGALSDAAAALNAMMQHPVGSGDLNKIYNEFLTACCEKATSGDELKIGLDIIPLAHQCSLVISATVLRMLLCASFKHGLKAHAKEYLQLGTRVGIYPVVSVSCPGPKTVQLQSDLAKDEIQVVLTNLFVKLKKYLMDSLQTRELDVIQECTVKLTALSVGNRDAKFIELHKIQSSDQAVLQRASEILQTPSHFQSVISTRFLSENGVNVLKLDGTMVYQCVYYVDEDV